MYLPNVASLTTLPNPIAPGEYIVGGYSTVGDGGEGTFIWVTGLLPPNVSSDGDGGIIFTNPAATSGYFKRIFSGPVNVR